MQTKTKRLLLLIAAPLTILLVLALAYLAISYGPTTELPSRLSRYHNLGEITLTVDGENVSPNGMEITLHTQFEEHTERIKNGNFRFLHGDYGPNTLTFTIPAALFGGKQDIPVTIEYFNYNNWHVNHYQMEIAIVTQEGTTAMRAQVQAITDREPHIFKNAAASLDDPAMILRASY